MEPHGVSPVEDFLLHRSDHHHLDDRSLMTADQHHISQLPVLHNLGDFQLNSYYHTNYSRPTTMVEQRCHPQPPYPRGMKFRPKDHRLIEYYLKGRQQNFLFPPELFLDVLELNKYGPEDLIGLHEKLEASATEEKWYFFTKRERKYENGSQPQRTVEGSGYWKTTTKETPVHGSDGSLVGYRRPLDFFKGKHPHGVRSEWKMHEFVTEHQKNHVLLPPTEFDDWILCKIYKNQRGSKRSLEQGFEEKNESKGVDEVGRLLNVVPEGPDYWQKMYNLIRP